MDASIQEAVDKNKPLAEQLVARLGDAQNTAATYSYDCQVSVASAGGGFLNVDFKKNGKKIAQFKGGFGGGVGGYTGWGTAWFDTPVESLIGKSGAFTIEVVGILGGTAHVQISDASTYIGNCSTGGVGIGGGVGAGGGKFSA